MELLHPGGDPDAPARTSSPDIPFIDAMREDDWEAVRAIYLDGIATGNATFETAAPSWERWDSGHLHTCRLVAREGARVLGWGALSRVSMREVYAGVAEVSIYVGRESRGRGIGRELLGALVRGSEGEGMWMLQAGIFPENVTSLELHKHAGFREVGRRERIGLLHGVWRDVILLERRSRAVGV